MAIPISNNRAAGRQQSVFINVYSGKDSQPVGSRSFFVELNAPAAEVGDRVLTDMLRVGIAHAMNWFAQEYIPLRFTRYATEELGYTVTKSTWGKKRKEKANGNPDAMQPNTYKGEMKKEILAGMKARTMAVGGARSGTVNCKLILPGIKTGRNRISSETLNKVTPREAKRIMDMFEMFVKEIASRMITVQVRTRKGPFSTRSKLDTSTAYEVQHSMRGSTVKRRN